MTDLSAFPVTRLYPPAHPERLQLYSKPTPNGVKASIALEEIGLPYEVHAVDFGASGTGSAEYRAVQPVGKIPAILDPDAPDGRPIAVFESGAILLYLADKTGKLISPDPARRMETIEWLFWQNAGLGVMLGNFHFYFGGAGKDIADKSVVERFRKEAIRFLDGLERRFDRREWVVDDYSIADVTMIGWIRAAFEKFDAAEELELGRMTNIRSWLDRVLERPAVQRGLTIPS